MSTVARYEIRRAGPRFGAEATGIDLKAGVDDRTADYGGARAYRKVIGVEPVRQPAL
ncbi:hypothetical protein [Streptomyces zaehneri]|uniref:hypothetical protein n=1 Tax=Streptomyces zaehneri TaxID=3051180 RepID=UPI0028D86795|nr:hypothetical protein [Streptomyces sp. DSM 40713]